MPAWSIPPHVSDSICKNDKPFMSNVSAHPTAAQHLQAELTAVQQQLSSAIEELYPPLSELVRAQFKVATPPLRAAIVLTAGVGEPDTEALRENRIFLAAALEMLYIALHIHHLLVMSTQTNGENAADKSLLGSIILAGDYCFSRSAILAARTNNPEVVMLFSTALKIVSEGKLRQYFIKENLPFNENQKLFEAGVRAAATLAQLPEETREALAVLGATITFPSLSTDSFVTQYALRLPQTLAPAQQARWLVFLEWLSALQ